MSPACGKALLPGVVPMEGYGAFKRQGLERGLLVTGGMSLGGVLGTQLLSPFLFQTGPAT